MTGKRVEAFLPDREGRIPAEPTPITRSGYEPSPLRPETFNAWQRFFSRHGFYSESFTDLMEQLAADSSGQLHQRLGKEIMDGQFQKRFDKGGLRPLERQPAKAVPVHRGPSMV